MSTVAKTEAASEQLPRREHESLLEYLVQKLGPRDALASAPREDWLRQLDRLRARGATLVPQGASLQEAFDDLLAERLP